ncbi:nitrate reductase [Chelatococcus reniformis]|uniref:Nitrate reductase n=1 Tax=Chelatococcus reniformis TaxID=1494448 RepID=A0A916UY72_9HYPH|nr:nitrate reductase [Chelatococcus reniformis]GGC92420.1 nitrate reductase [Chelatococcus reniformis]
MLAGDDTQSGGHGPGLAPANAGVKTACPYCGVGCGIVATPRPDGAVDIGGDAEHPANFGRLCSKGSALGETLDLDDRLLVPEIDGQRASWDAALARVAETFSATIAAHGPDSVALYVSGQLLTEDYYVANKLMKGFVGSANIDTNSRLCMASSVAGHVRAFGSDTVPGAYEDLETADLVVLVGSNLAWCHPVLFQRLAAAKAGRGTRIVTIDPRATASSEASDLHLAVAPDSDVALFAGLLDHLEREGCADRAYIEAHTRDAEPALAAARACGLAGAAAATGIDEHRLAAFYRLWAGTPRVVTVYSQGVNQSVVGTDKVSAIINCHLFTGRIGRAGAGPFSVTGQPNAMGGREVGGLANMLAAHMSLADPGHRDLVQRFWRSPVIADRPGLKAVDMFRAVADGRIKALWIMSTNPADSLPKADAAVAALANCPFVVVSDIVRTDTTRHAHVLLPAAGWGEKSGTVTNSERRISRQRAFLAPPGEARADWRIICDVAARMGFAEAFAFASEAEVFREHAALSAHGNDGSRDFDIGGLADLGDAAYADLAPVQWPRARTTAAPEGPIRLFADGGFFTADRRARFVATPLAPARAADPRFPLILNTGRIRDQWHTMTRTGKSPRLMGHLAEPLCEIHPADAAAHAIATASLVQLESPHGTMLARALVTERQRRGSVFAAMHWTDQFAAKGRVDALVDDAVDPVSGQPGLKGSAVRIQPFAAAWHGFAILRERPRRLGFAYWALAKAVGGWRLELADTAAADDFAALASDLFTGEEPGGDALLELLSYRDRRHGHHRFAAFRDGDLVGAIWIAPGPVAVSRAWAVERLAEQAPTGARRLRLLSGRAAADQPDPGALVCSCFSVGANQIAAAIAEGAASVEAVGAVVRAGTNCGSCRGEIGRILATQQLPAAAE